MTGRRADVARACPLSDDNSQGQSGNGVHLRHRRTPHFQPIPPRTMITPEIGAGKTAGTHMEVSMSRSHSFRAFAALLAILAFGIASRAVAQTPVRIMPLGDSITAGPGCWRALSLEPAADRRLHEHRLRRQRHRRRRLQLRVRTTSTTKATAASRSPASPIRTSCRRG